MENKEEKQSTIIAEDGHKVKVEYKGTFDDGEVFDSSDGREPLEFVIGAGQVIPGFNDAIKGMKVGDSKDISLEPKDAYGEKDERLVQEVPLEAFGEHKVKKGDQIGIKGPTGHVMPVVISDVKEKTVVVDLNHPMAGKKLNFNLKLVDSKKLTEKELEEMNSHSCGSCSGHDHDHGDHGCGGGCC